MALSGVHALPEFAALLLLLCCQPVETVGGVGNLLFRSTEPTLTATDTCHASWTPAKKKWCCENEGVTDVCPVTTTTARPPGPTPKPTCKPMICDLNCYGDGAAPFPLPGATGTGDNLAVSGQSLDGCRSMCQNAAGCDGVVFGNGQCYGKQDFHLAKCNPHADFKTEVTGYGKLPWGKCTCFGDPHCTAFDGGQHNRYNVGDYWLVKSDVLKVQGRFGWTKRFPAAMAAAGKAEGTSMLGVGADYQGHRLIVEYVGPAIGFTGFKVLWDKTEILTQMGQTYAAAGIKAQAGYMEPTDFHDQARHTIGDGADQMNNPQPSFYFEISPDLNIYLLIGLDSVNMVLETRKVHCEQDGLCGNFDCRKNDDSNNVLRENGLWQALPLNDSIFQGAPDPPAETMVKIPGFNPSIADCEPTLLARAQTACLKMPSDQNDACIFDVCAAGDTTVAEGDIAIEQIDEPLEYDCHCVTSTQAAPTTITTLESYNCSFAIPFGADRRSEWCCQFRAIGCSTTAIFPILPTVAPLQPVVPTAAPLQPVVPTAVPLQPVDPTAAPPQPVVPTAPLQPVVPTGAPLQPVDPPWTPVVTPSPFVTWTTTYEFLVTTATSTVFTPVTQLPTTTFTTTSLTTTTMSTTSTSTSTSSTSTTTTTTTTWDCLYGYSNWFQMWPEEKKNWCCVNSGRGCPTTSTLIPTTTTHVYNCLAFTTCFNCLAKQWAPDKMAWCCSHKNVGCPTTTTPPTYDCAAGYSNWQAGWSDDKKAWCCEHSSRGCHAPVPTPNLGTTTVDCPYDCSDASMYNGCFACLVKQWSAGKLLWCCEHENLGCPKTTTLQAVTTPDPYDCVAGFNNWRAGWSVGKKVWCCENKHVACPIREDPYDCDAGYSNWQAGWSLNKKAWCCDNKNLGCPKTTTLQALTTSDPYDCVAGFSNWRAGWSVGKKVWCCENKHVACPSREDPYDCNAGYSNWQAGWSLNKKAWCCDNKNLGCPSRPALPVTRSDRYNCMQGYSNWRRAWPLDKKVFCCHSRAVGCQAYTSQDSLAISPLERKFDDTRRSERLASNFVHDDQNVLAEDPRSSRSLLIGVAASSFLWLVTLVGFSAVYFKFVARQGVAEACTYIALPTRDPVALSGADSSDDATFEGHA